MKKFIYGMLCVLLVLAMSLCVLAACNPDANTTEPPKEEKPPVVETDPLYTVTVPYSAEYTVQGIRENGYEEGQKVSFTLTVTNTEKEVDSVTSPDVAILSDNGTYSFFMPAKDVTVTVTLKSVKGDETAEIQLFMRGALYEKSMRSIYVILNGSLKGKSVRLDWESSAPEVVAISTSGDSLVQGKMPEVMLHAMGTGTATIKCSLQNDPSRFATYQVEVKPNSEGASLPSEIINKLSGAMKVETLESFIDYPLEPEAYAERIPTVMQNRITTIFEEIADGTTKSDYTDAYQLEVKNSKGETTDLYKYVCYAGKVAIEELNIDNQVTYDYAMSEDVDSDSKKMWDQSAYRNIFAFPDYCGADTWKSFDDGKTYHFVGTETAAKLFCVCFFLKGGDYFSPDDMFLTVDGDSVKLTVEIDPTNYENNQGFDVKHGHRYESEFSEFGTARIDHVTPYAREDFHSAIDAAKAKMANQKNYMAKVTYDDFEYEYIYLEDTIDSVSKENGVVAQHTGWHNNNDGTYYSYQYDDTTKALVKTKTITGDWASNYPTFVFASEIFTTTSEKDTYTTRGGLGYFVVMTSYLSPMFGYSSFSYDGTLTIGENGFITKISTQVKEQASIGGEVKNLTIEFSAFDSASVDLDFSTVQSPTVPLTWEDGAAKLYAEMQAASFPELPYVHPENDWDYAMGVVQGSYIYTEKFNSEQTRDQFISDFKAALLNAGWELTEEKEEDTNYDLYEKDGYKVSVGANYNYVGGKATLVVKIKIYFP